MFLKLITDAQRMAGIMSIVEDERGQAERLQVYKQSNEDSPQQILPKGRVVAITEPYYKVSADGGCCLRVDHPSDIVLLSPMHDCIPIAFKSSTSEPMTAMQWKEAGNMAVARKDFAIAIDWYAFLKV